VLPLRVTWGAMEPRVDPELLLESWSTRQRSLRCGCAYTPAVWKPFAWSYFCTVLMSAPYIRLVKPAGRSMITSVCFRNGSLGNIEKHGSLLLFIPLGW